MSGRYFIVRHSLSTYQNMRNVIESENPEGIINYDNQVFDVPPKGIELAEKKAMEFFSGLNPVKDLLYFLSSNEARAIDTANIYRKTAKAMGFKVLRSYTGECTYAEISGEREIRVLDSLGLYPQNVLLHSIYNSNPSKVFAINWELVKERTRLVWDKARLIIESDDRGSWGGNFTAHSSVVKEILKSVNSSEKSAEDLYVENFQHLVKLIGLIGPKTCSNSVGIAFGHENYLTIALRKYFDEDGIGNCEAMGFTVTDIGHIVAGFRGKEAIIG